MSKDINRVLDDLKVSEYKDKEAVIEVIETLRDLFMEGFESDLDHDLEEWEERAKSYLGIDDAQ